MNPDVDRLLEPAESFKTVYKETFDRNVDELFASLVKRSGIDVEGNRKSAKEYRAADAKAQKTASSLHGRKALRVLLIVLAVVAVIVSIAGFAYKNLLVGLIPIPIAILSIVPVFAKINKGIRNLQGQLAEEEAAAQALLETCRQQMNPLFNLFDSTMTADLIQSTVPTLKFDVNFDMRRYDYLRGKYGLGDCSDCNRSLVGLLSGEINGNPFLFEKHFLHRMGSQRYTGHITIHWTTTYRDSKGNTRVQHHSQVLTASVVKPKPFYRTEVQLIYGNDAAPDLSFTHERTHAERMSEGQLRSTVKSRLKKIRKKAKKEVLSGFTEMGNEEFDALFGAIDRDNETQFRLLFTPLAQKNLLDLMKGKSPFGDDFNLYKRKGLNYVVSEHAQERSFDTDPRRYESYDVDLCKQKFTDFNRSYFASVFFDLAPLLSIPAYQQIRPKEYDYAKSYDRNYTEREAEVLANKLGEKRFAHPATRTPVILKTRLDERDGDADRLSVKAFSYRTVRRVDFRVVLGGDGRMHTVPVPWIEYIPISKLTKMTLHGSEMTEEAWRQSHPEAQNVPHVYYHRLLAVLGEDDLLTDDAPDAAEEADLDQYGEVEEDGGDLDEVADAIEDEIDDD